jgi:uncharacterized protein
MKFLVVLLVVGVVLWMLVARSRERPAGSRRRTDAAGAAEAPQAMVECAHCGLHLPAADALLEGSRVYCSQAHRQLGPRRTDVR